MKKLRIQAKLEKLETLVKETNASLAAASFSNHDKVLIDTALEEVFVNIVKYAMKSDGEFTYIIDANEKGATFTFIDTGKEFNPLERDDPDITLSAEQRAIGGLGIFMVKKIMDEVSYEYKDNQNILKLTKYRK